MEDELKDEVQGLRRPENRSLLEVNEDFQGKRNAAMRFLVIFFFTCSSCI